MCPGEQHGFKRNCLWGPVVSVFFVVLTVYNVADGSS